MRTIRIPRLSQNAPVSALLFLSLLSATLSFVTAQQQIVQLTAVALLAGAAIFSLLLRRMRPAKLSPFELVLLFCALTSAFISSLMGFYGASQYAFVLFLCMISIAAIVRTLSLREILNVFVLISIALLLIPLVSYRPQLVAALSLKISDIGLERFTPFDMHPNLVGFTYAGTAMIMACRTLIAPSRTGKFFGALLTALSLLFIVAASARSAMLGVAVSGVLYIWAFATARGGNRKRRLQLLIILGVLAVAALGMDPMRGYLLSAFEVQSESRGVDSGATGRVELWTAGIDLLLANPFRTLFGFGFRSAEYAIIGFPVESSYIVLCLEIGVLGAALLLGIFLVSSMKMILIGRTGAFGDDGRILQFFGLAIIAFMVHSIFNRYLVGIGNPMSLMALVMMSAYGVRHRSQKTASVTTGAPAVPAVPHTLPSMGNLS